MGETKDKEYSEETLLATAEKWRNKKCPACGSDLGKYEFAGVLYPYHMHASTAIGQTDLYPSREWMPALMPMAAMRCEFFRALLASTCRTCDLVSLWNARQVDIVSLLKHADIDFGLFDYIQTDILQAASKVDNLSFRQKAFDLMIEYINSSGGDAKQ